MTQRQKKSPRDLTDLKARLGLAKPSAEPAVPAPGGNQTAPAEGQTKPASPNRSAGIPAPVPQPVVTPPPGIVAPPGFHAPAPAQPAAAPPPDVRRDPFAQTGPAPRYQGQPIVDAGPPIEIPKEKKSNAKFIIALIPIILIPLALGWACGRIYAGRFEFNKSIEDAKKIQTEVGDMAKVNNQIAQVMHQSRIRNKSVVYDEKLMEQLKEILRNSPEANPAKTKARLDKLFRTNYAKMEDILINRLFNYYNNTIRLLAEVERFVQNADSTSEQIKSYTAEAGEGQRKYGIIFEEDKGTYFLGRLVELGDFVCADNKARSQCKNNGDIKGFMIRMGSTGTWSPRVGKPEKRKNISEIVIPIVPDEHWRQVAMGKPGYLAYKEFALKFGKISAIAALLARDEKELVKDLGKVAGRNKLFLPF